MFSSPIHGIVDLDRVYFLGKTKAYRCRHPLPPIYSLDTVSILPFVLFVLDIVQETKDIGFINFINIPQPGEIMRLMNGSDQ
jgi:hypothetical protein